MAIASLHFDLLRQFARMELDEDDTKGITSALNSDLDWTRFLYEAEQHGLSPLIYFHINHCKIDIPKRAKMGLRALRLRHKLAQRIRANALNVILHAFEKQQIEVVILKGAALAYLIYPSPDLRPMRDIDLLVTHAHLHRARSILEDFGYTEMMNERLHPDHHHLPTLAKVVDGLNISVELHHDAISPDNIGSITLSSLTEKTQKFQHNGKISFAFGHIDMLRHLCRHTLGHHNTTKLGSALDTLSYAARFEKFIDWRQLQTDHPEVPITLQLLSYLIPCPPALRPHLPEQNPPICEQGIGLAPLSEVFRQKYWWVKLFNPSDWWLHGFYGIAPGQSLLYTKIVTHPCRILWWLWRRMRFAKYVFRSVHTQGK